jgi:hypothetical protein
MADVNWKDILSQAIAAAQGVLKQEWPIVTHGAESQIIGFAQSAEYIAEHKKDMKPIEYKTILANHKRYVRDTLLMYEDIGIATAEKAAQAVWDVIGKALQTAIGVAIKIP